MWKRSAHSGKLYCYLQKKVCQRHNWRLQKASRPGQAGGGNDKPSGYWYDLHTVPSIPEELDPWFEAAAQRCWKGSSGPKINCKANAFGEEEYWPPAEPLTCPLPFPTSLTIAMPVVDSGRNACWSSDPWWKWIPDKHMDDMLGGRMKSVLAGAPLVTSVTAAVVVGMTSGMDAAISSQVPHAVGPLPAVFTSIAGMQKCFWLLLYRMPLAPQFVVWLWCLPCSL